MDSKDKMRALLREIRELDLQRHELFEEMARQADGMCPYEWAKANGVEKKLWSQDCRQRFGVGCRWGGDRILKRGCWHRIVFILPEDEQ